MSGIEIPDGEVSVPRRVMLLPFLGLLAALVLPAGALLAGSSVKVGSFTKSTNTSVPVSESVTHNLGVTPKAIILWTSSSTNESFSADLEYSIGFSDGTTSKSASASSQDAVSTTNTSARMANKAITIVQYGETVLAEADLSTWDSTSLSLSWTTNNATAYVIHYMIIGGTDVSAKVINWTLPTTTGNHAVTGVGFRPVVVLHAQAGGTFTSTPSASVTNARIGLGAMDISGAQWGTNATSLDGLPLTSVAERRQRTNQFFLAYGGVKTLTWVSMDNDGFTVNDASSSTSASQVISLCLKGVDAKVGSFSKSTSTSVPVSQAVTGMGFQPKAVLLSSFQNTATTSAPSNCRIGLGASDGSTQGCLAVTDAQKSGFPLSTEVDRIDKTSKVFMKVDNNSHAIDAEAGLSSLDSGGFTLSWTTNDAVASEILYFALGSIASSAVDLESFDAKESAAGVLLRWRTANEIDNLGFHLWREEGGAWERLTASLVPGSALAWGGSGPTMAHSYRFLDPGDHDGARYWLEDVDLNAARTVHGPAVPAAAISTPRAPSSNKRQAAATIPGRGAAPRAAGVIARKSTAVAQVSPAGLPPPLPSPRLGPAAIQAALAARLSLKISVREPGWYRLTQPQLIAAGLDPKADPRRLSLFVEGREVPIRVTGAADGRFGPKDYLEFYGVGTDTAFTESRVYWLDVSARRGLRIGAIPRLRTPRARPTSFSATVQHRPRTTYFAALLNGEASNFFGEPINAEPATISLAATHLDPRPASDPTLAVALQGVTAGAHQVRLVFNSLDLGVLEFQGREHPEAEVTVPASSLREGENLLQLQAEAGEVDVSLVDSVTLKYLRTYEAEENSLTFTAPGRSLVTVTGFTEKTVQVFDVTVPDSVRQIHATVFRQGNGFAVRATIPGTSTRTLLARSSRRALEPASIKPNQPSHWRDGAYDYVVITDGTFVESLAPLAALREGQGLRVALVPIGDLYDEFSYGMKDSRAIYDYLRSASPRPRFVLLVGDASFDPRGFLGRGDPDVVPTQLIGTDFLETASDDGLVDLDGDGIPDIPVGRLPARTEEEAARMASKIVAAEEAAGQSWTRTALLVSDRSTEGMDFSAMNRSTEGSFPEGYMLQELALDDLDPASAWEELRGLLGEGVGLVSYFGHGSVERWSAPALLTSAKARDLENGSRLPIVLAMTCLNGFFHDVYTESLAEALLRSERGGAVAVWASSSLTNPAGQQILLDEFLRAAFDGTGATVGEAILRAKAAVSDADVRRTWILFGDPAARLR